MKKQAKKRSGPDPQNTLQPHRSGCNSIGQVLLKARTKKIIDKTASSNQESENSNYNLTPILTHK